MKIALLLTGPLKTTEMLKYVHRCILMKKHETDVFLSVDASASEGDDLLDPILLEETIAFFKPVSYLVHSDFSVVHSDMESQIHPLLNKIFPIEKCRPFFQEYYVVKQAYGLLEKHREGTGASYDMVLRLRFDQLIWTPKTKKGLIDFIYQKGTISFTEENIKIVEFLTRKFEKDISVDFNCPEDGALYVFGFGDFHDYKYANDQFFYHSLSLAKIIPLFYDELPELINDNLIRFPDKGCMTEFFFYTF